MNSYPFVPSCLACGGRLEFFGRRDNYDYARCVACRTIQLAPFPTVDELSRAYSEDYPKSGHQGTDPVAISIASSPFYQTVLDALRSSGVARGPILDFGCGWGGMCRLLRDSGYAYLGVDYASASLDYCKRQGLQVRTDSLTNLGDGGERFTAVVMITVFEHLHDHAQTIRDVRRVLQSNGLLLILIPTAAIYGLVATCARRLSGSNEIPAVNTTFCPPWHTAIFSLAGADRLLTDNGFQKVAVLPAPSAKGRGLLGIAQHIATLVARLGYSAVGDRWPLVLNHLLVYRAT